MANIYLISSMVTVAERNICHACGAGPKLLPLSWLRATFPPSLAPPHPANDALQVLPAQCGHSIHQLGPHGRLSQQFPSLISLGNCQHPTVFSVHF